MMDTADKIAVLTLNSPKRQLALEKWIDDALEGGVCCTRWEECVALDGRSVSH